ncbi:site-specific integrase [Lactobacillus sp. LC28-10]|uniref:Site-specific integrase n=1 Tax=Secundilactobacillus angelensis TaxID=2722706 RepID=A0ABX1L081_9LACO|nr:site-specific integrase [Secundilactobacillus angelensis]MCH5463231.1 site-specific integrase [Secundilactobacillus angelensis]NLR19622.1 site-specific integrase [Secundilactobacillus angelensis]
MASITKRGNNYNVRIFDAESGKRVSQSFPTKKMAQVWANKIELKKFSGIGVVQSQDTLPEYMHGWFKTFKEPTISNTTKKRYLNTLKVVDENWEGQKISEITRTQYQRFLNRFGKHHSLASSQKLHSQIRASIRDAMDDGIITNDFTKRARISGSAGKNEADKYLDKPDMESLITELKRDVNATHPSKTMALVSLYTGARYEEVAALQWSDISEKFGTVNISKAWDADEEDFKPTKNDQSNRTVPVNKGFFDFMYQYWTSFQQVAAPDPHDLIFVTPHGKVPTSTAVNNMLHAALKRIGAKQISFHGLRHTHASYLIYSGISLYAISKHLGHANFNVTLSTYSHIFSELESRENKNLISALNSLAPNWNKGKSAGNKRSVISSFSR